MEGARPWRAEEGVMASRGQGKVDLNAVSAEQLAQQIEGIDMQRARSIIEHRERSGGFESWKDVERVPGVGKSMMQKLQAGATIGEAKAEPAKPAKGAEKTVVADEPEAAEEVQAAEEFEEIEAVEEVEPEEIEAAEEEGAEVDEADLVALLALAEMDLGAAAAYQIGAHCFEDEDPKVSETLLSFREDHLRHVESLERLAVAMGGEPIDRDQANESVLARLAEAAEALGPRAAILAMISNEQLTNSTYGSILEIEWEDEVKKVLERNFEDERRHLSWLEQNRERFAEEEEQPEATV
jgi:competence ComEA-like helix-hairpin-helix protein